MWYTVLVKDSELTTSISFDPVQLVSYNAGSVFSAKAISSEMVRLDLLNLDDDGSIKRPGEFVVLTKEECKQLFTKPTQSFFDAVEESVMVCEAAYC